MINTGVYKRRALETKTMSFSRRHREHLSSTRMSQVEVQGESYLCFSRDHSWFQGNISTEDESNYSVFGEKIQKPGTASAAIQLSPSSTATTPNESEDEVESELPSNPPTADCYRMILTDHFTGLSYALNNITLNSKAAQNKHVSLFNSPEAQIHFRVDQVHKGQKADMVIQRSLGSTSCLLGRKCLVYVGLMDIVFTDYEGMDSGRSWNF